MASIVRITEGHTQPTIITLERAKQQLRFDDPSAAHDEDVLIQAYIDAAISYAENYTCQEIKEKKFKINGKSFDDALTFNKQLIQSIDLIRYKDANGDLQTISDSNYQLQDVDDYERKIEFSEDFDFPTVQDYRFDAVQISVTVGYASGAVPEDMQIAILMLIGHYYENRQDAVKEKCTAAENMLAKYRRY